MTRVNLKWKNISKQLLDLLNKEWQDSRNVNAYLFARFTEKYPIFEKQELSRGGPNVKNYVLKKSLYHRVINKVMSCGHTHTGKKVLSRRILDAVLEDKSKELRISKTSLLILCLVKSVPNGTVRRLKFGSGHLTRAVRLTVLKKVSWFLCSLALVFKDRRQNFHTRVSQELSAILGNALNRSKLLLMKKEAHSMVEKANIQ